MNYFLFHLVNKGIFQEKNGKPKPFGCLEISSFPHTSERVNFGQGLPYFSFHILGVYKMKKELNYSNQCNYYSLNKL